jgi:hypothetical protein
VLIAQKLNGTQLSAAPALSDCFLFGALKGRSARRTFELVGELLGKICEMTSGIPRAKLDAMLLKWEENPQRCINVNGVHADSALEFPSNYASASVTHRTDAV